MITAPRLLLFFSLATSVSCTEYRTLPDRSIILPGSDAVAFQTLCSRPGLQKFQGVWQPRQEDIDRMEKRFARLMRLRSQSCCILRGRIQDVNAYYRQYVGVVIEGRRFIYVNAYAAEPPTPPSDQPRVHACDGGASYWGTLYDVKKGHFEGLAFNGEA